MRLFPEWASQRASVHRILEPRRENVSALSASPTALSARCGDLDRDTLAPFLTRNGGEITQPESPAASGDEGGGQPQQPMVRIIKADDGSYGFLID